MNLLKAAFKDLRNRVFSNEQSMIVIGRFNAAVERHERKVLRHRPRVIYGYATVYGLALAA